MIIQLQENLTISQIEKIQAKLLQDKTTSNYVNTQHGKYLICFNKTNFDIRNVGHLEGVKDVHKVSDDYKLVSKKWKVNNSSVIINNTPIGANTPLIIAGPCSVESESQILEVIEHLKENNINFLRGGVFKPRSSPYSFRGLGIEGLKMLHHHCHKNNIKIVTEVMELGQIEDMYPYVDVFQVGARNSQNYNLLDALGSCDKTVLLKRGISGTIEELLYSAEYVFSKGNENIILCERGIRTFEQAYRNTFDINAILMLKEKTHLPVIADPSHGIGIRSHVPKLALSSLMAGADGIIYEVHPRPEEAKSDGQQTLNFSESTTLIKKVNELKTIINFN